MENEHNDRNDPIDDEALKRRESLTDEQLANLEPGAKAKIAIDDSALITALEAKWEDAERDILLDKIIEGKALNRLKIALPHGKFEEHCRAQWDFGKSWTAQLMYLGREAHRLDEARAWADQLTLVYYSRSVDDTNRLLRAKAKADEKAKSGEAWTPEPKAKRTPRTPGSGVEKRANKGQQPTKAAGTGASENKAPVADAEDRTGSDEAPGSEVPFADNAPPTAPEDISEPEMARDETVSEGEDTGEAEVVDAAFIQCLRSAAPAPASDFATRLDELAAMIPNKPRVLVEQVDRLKSDYEFVVKTNRSLREDLARVSAELARANASARGFKSAFEEAEAKLKQVEGAHAAV